ncbi:MAG: hypothetical protein ACRDL5_17270 [Solirubrobacteraceae bacterium]
MLVFGQADQLPGRLVVSGEPGELGEARGPGDRSVLRPQEDQS